MRSHRAVTSFVGLIALITTTLITTTVNTQIPIDDLLSKVWSLPATACDAIAASLSSQSAVHHSGISNYTDLIEHYITSSSQDPSCVVEPVSAEDLAAVIRIIGLLKTPFAIKSGGHTANPGFSSTTGVHISMSRFGQVVLSSDKSRVDIGTGQTWGKVYTALDGTGRNVVGGRVFGVGVGGFVVAGGGFSWLSNQYGLAIDNVISYEVVTPQGQVVTASETSNPDLFFALRGGGNDIGIVTNIKMITRPQGKVWGGTRTYSLFTQAAILKAVSEFDAKNKDPKAVILYTQTTFAGLLVPFVFFFYDGPNPGTAFAAFDNIPDLDLTRTRSFVSLIKSNPSPIGAGFRGIFASLPLKAYNLEILKALANQTSSFSRKSLLLSNTGFMCTINVEPFLDYSIHDQGGAWPHSVSYHPTHLYVSWISSKDDKFWIQTLKDGVEHLREVARAQGQNMSHALLYPNYAMATDSLEAMYGENLPRLKAIKAAVDPDNIMGLAGGFKFAGSGAMAER